MITWKSPLCEIPSPRKADDRRRVVVANALACADLSAGDPDTEPMLRALLGPPPPRTDWPLEIPYFHGSETLPRPPQQGVNTSGLVAEGILARSGVGWDCLQKPAFPGQRYRPITRTVANAKLAQVWVDAWEQHKPDPRPGPGCCVVIGCQTAGEAYHGAAHALTLIGWIDADVLDTIEGGHIDFARGCLPCVRRRRRRWIMRKGRPWLVDPDDDPGLTVGRRVLGWVRTNQLRLRSNCIVPKGWETVEIAKRKKPATRF